MSQPLSAQNTELINALNAKNALIKQLSAARLQLEHKKQLKRRSELTLEELAPIEDDAVAYRAVGRMFIKENLPAVREEINTIIVTEEQAMEKLEKSVAALDQRVRAAEADIRELLNQVQQQTTIPTQ
eukprot:UN00060